LPPGTFRTSFVIHSISYIMFASRIARSTVVRRALYSTQSEAPAGLNAGEKHIYEKLSEALSPHKLQVADVSGKITRSIRFNRSLLLIIIFKYRWLRIYVCY
jgi:hypothetical protein